MKAQMYGFTQAVNWPTPPDTASPTELGRIAGRLSEMLREMDNLGARLHEAANRAMGPTPTGCGEAVATPQPSSMVGQIDELLQNMSGALVRCIEATDRLERLA